MDSLTQAVLGASIQGASLGKYQGRKAYLYGALLATIPDLDVFLHYPNPIDSMTYHRSFSHSLWVLIPASLVLSGAIYTWYKKRQTPLPYTFSRLAITLMLVLITHPLLDSFTVYGTQLFWFADSTPISIGSVFIIDPIYTLPLLIATIMGLVKGQNLTQFNIGKVQYLTRLAMIALGLSSLYLGVSLWLQSWAYQQAQQTLQQANINITALKTMTTTPNILLWRSLAKGQDGKIYEVRGSVLDKPLPEYRQLDYPIQTQIKTQLPADSLSDYQRLSWFTGDWIALKQVDNQLIVDDLRMYQGDIPLFSFVLAKKENNPSSQNSNFIAQMPTRYPSWLSKNMDTQTQYSKTVKNKTRFQQLKQTWQRSFNSQLDEEELKVWQLPK